ncbi:metallophosphoesterase [Phycisphaerales bacterium AB-hyl4]|uniref:Metallophosphoesterase n=1 Tax=Natronomicrosphaera hydrolytica TaxID=3242702 RepID=A0ABV4U473_9BACT
MRFMLLIVGWLLASVLANLNPAAAEEAEPRPQLRIALLADPHISVRPDAAEHRRNFERIIEKVNAEQVDAVLIAGDLTTHGFRMAVEDFQGYIDRLDAPVHLVPGNHDIGNKPLPDRETNLSNDRLAHYESAFGPSFYEARLASGVRLVALNSLLMGTDLQREPDQWAFLEESLAEPADSYTIVMTHHPPFVEQPDEPNDYFNIEPESRSRLLALLARAEVDLLVAGHTHRPLEHEHDGTRHIIAPAISFGLPHDQQPEGWTLLTLNADNSVTREDRFLAPEEAEVDEDWLAKLETIAPIAVMPMAEPGNRVARFFRDRGVEEVLAPLTGEQMVDEEHFTPDRYPVTLYLSGEAFRRSVHEPGDVERALLRYLRAGGVLAVLPSLPFPFYADERGEEVLSAGRFGLMLLASGEQEGDAFGFERPEEDEQLRFIVHDATLRELGLPESLDYPEQGDQRWRPQVELRSRDEYEALISLVDEEGRARGDGAVFTEHFNLRGEPTGRTLYVASVLTHVHPQRDTIIEGILTFLVQRVRADADAPATADE